MEQSIDRRSTLEEYLEFEARSENRHEYRNGFVLALATPTGNHGRISGNLAMALGSLLRSEGCDFFLGDAKVVTPSGDRLIPDFMATCDEADRESIDAAGENVVAHPWLVVEILSPPTASDDLTTKMDSYQSMPGVTHYLVIDSRRRAMRIFERTNDGKFTGSGSVSAVTFSRLGRFELGLDDVYRDTSVPQLEDVAPTD